MASAFNGLPETNSPVAFEMWTPAPAKASMYTCASFDWLARIWEYLVAYCFTMSSLTSDQ